jgi:hypothetical protein
MAKFVLDSYALDSKKSEAKAKVAGALGSSVSISGNEIEVPSYAAEKVAQILSQVGIKYSGG